MIFLPILMMLSSAQGPGSVGEFQFPTQPISPQAIALGGTGVASATDAILNPALLFGVPRIALQGYQGFSGYKGVLVSGNLPLGRHLAFGVDLRRYGWDNLIQDSLGADVSGLDASQNEITITGAFQPIAAVAVGVAASRMAIGNFGVNTAGLGLAAGISVIYHRRGSFGLAVRNIGRPVSSPNSGVAYPMPTRWRVGAAQGFQWGDVGATGTIEIEGGGRPPFESFHGGMEWNWRGLFKLRGGFETVPDFDTGVERSRGAWSFGVGVVVAHIELAIGTRTGGIPEGLETSLGLSLIPQ